MFFTLSTTLFILSPLLVNARNDWNTACVGSCSYEAGDGVNRAWSTILIDGASDAVSDISNAAGWSIMDCDSSSTEDQTIRLVCHDPDAGCEQLFEGGAEDTIVRLPEECADAPFARVVKVVTSKNQTLTSDVARLVNAKRRRASPPEVMDITIDFNFHLLPASRGTVSFTSTATTNPYQKPLTDSQHVRRALGYSEEGTYNARSGYTARELVDREIRRRDLFADFIANNRIPADITSSQVITTSGTGLDKVSLSMVDTNSTGPAQKWQHDWDKTFDLININESFPVADASLSCPQNGDVPAFSGSVKVDADVDLKVTVSVGFIVAGTIIPPAITKAAFTSALDGHAQAKFKIQASVQGKFDTGLLPLYSTDMSGLSIPGILSLGPKFSINAQAVGTLAVTTDATVTATYNFPQTSMVFPQDEGESNGQASQGDDPNPLVLAIGGSASLSGRVEAHVIPRVELGASAFFGAASASVYLQLDGYGALDMSLTVADSASTTVSPSPTIAAAANVANPSDTTTLPSTTSSANSTSSDAVPATPEDVPADSPPSDDTNNPAPPESVENKSNPDQSPDTTSPNVSDDLSAIPNDSSNGPNDLSVIPPPSNDSPAPNCPSRRSRRHRRRNVNVLETKHEARAATFGGCVGVDLGVKIVAGAQGKLLNWWKDSVSFDIFSQNWNIFNKCFETPLPRSLPPFRHGPAIPSSWPPATLQSRDIGELICPAITDTINAVNQIV